MRKIYNAPFNIKAQSTGQISAIFASMRVWDLDNDFTEQGAFGTQESIVLEGWNHDSKLPVGRGRIFEKGNDAIFEGQFFLQTQGGKDHFEVVKEMARSGNQEFSYTFNILKSEDVMHAGRTGRRLINLEVYGVSPVTRGAGINTRLLSIKDSGGHRIAPDGYILDDLRPASARLQISKLSLPKVHELREDLNNALLAITDKEFMDLQHRFKAAGGPSVLQIWREELKREGHSDHWIDVVLACETTNLARRIETNAYGDQSQTGWGLREALRILNSPPAVGRPLIFPEIGGNATSPLVII